MNPPGIGTPGRIQKPPPGRLIPGWLVRIVRFTGMSRKAGLTALTDWGSGRMAIHHSLADGDSWPEPFSLTVNGG